MTMMTICQYRKPSTSSSAPALLPFAITEIVENALNKKQWVTQCSSTIYTTST